MGVITGVVGGILRDVLTNEIPIVFRRETCLYATAAFLGATVFVLVNQWSADVRGVPWGYDYAPSSTGRDSLENRLARFSTERHPARPGSGRSLMDGLSNVQDGMVFRPTRTEKRKHRRLCAGWFHRGESRR